MFHSIQKNLHHFNYKKWAGHSVRTLRYYNIEDYEIANIGVDPQGQTKGPSSTFGQGAVIWDVLLNPLNNFEFGQIFELYAYFGQGVKIENYVENYISLSFLMEKYL